MKKCSSCNNTFDNSYFYKDKSKKNGLSSSCKQCSNKRAEEYNKNNPNKRKEASKKYYSTLPKDHYRHADLKRKYGITVEQFTAQLELQDYKCAICGKEHDPDKWSFAVDHCHVTGKVRGLLCLNCNNGIGKLKDSVDLLSKAIEYLINPPFKG